MVRRNLAEIFAFRLLQAAETESATADRRSSCTAANEDAPAPVRHKLDGFDGNSAECGLGEAALEGLNNIVSDSKSS